MSVATTAPRRRAPRQALRDASDSWFATGAGALCFLWAFLAWLSVIPNQDMLADAIQAQSVIHDPRIVLAFPGQRHSGTIEYPIQVLAELVAPGNYYVHTLARVGLAFVTGFLAAKLFTTLFPGKPRWPFIVAVAVGPTIIHGLSGPAGNSVGVFWLVSGYDTSWLLVTAGALVLARALRTGRPHILQVFAAGLLVGSGFFSHPNVMLLIAPLATLVLLSFPTRIWQVAVVLAGAVVGMTPAVVSYYVNADLTTWNPSHPPFIALGIYLNVLGLDGIPSYFTAVLPYAIGLPTSQTVMPGVWQSAFTWVFLLVACGAATVGVIHSLVHRSRPSAGTTLALAWCAAFAAMILFATFVDPVWFYATSLSVLLWITVGALPQVARWRPIGITASITLIVVAAFSTLTHNQAFYRDFGAQVAAKRQHLQDITESARLIKDAGAEYVYGSYLDVMPVGYASRYGLRTITSTYDRFPLSETELQQGEIVVATPVSPVEPWGERALEVVRSRCESDTRTVDTPVGPYGIFMCPPSAIDSRNAQS